jgi:hypothetical protein
MLPRQRREGNPKGAGRSSGASAVSLTTNLHPRSRTSCSASSTLRISSSVRCPISPPSARTSTGPTISHMTRVGSSSTTTSGWTLAAGVEVDVGQTRIVDSARRSSACTTTAKRRPDWTCPRRCGSVIARTSPRSTKLFHQLGDLARLTHVGGIASECSRLGREARASPFSLGRLCDRLACCLCTRHAPAPRDLVEGSHPVAAEAQRERRRRRRHDRNVAQIALQDVMRADRQGLCSGVARRHLCCSGGPFSPDLA